MVVHHGWINLRLKAGCSDLKKISWLSFGEVAEWLIATAC